MNWLASLGVGLLSGLVGSVIAFLIALLAIEWYRISFHDGAGAFAIVGVPLIVFVLGVILGIVCARMSAEPSFLLAWGRASAFIVAAGVVALTLMWLFADLPPKWDGQPLELHVELRAPPGFVVPPLEHPQDAYVTILRQPDQDPKGFNPLQLDQIKTVDDRLVIPGMLILSTSAREKRLCVRFGKHLELLFPLEFGARPDEKYQAWSEWTAAAAPAGSAFQMRYRVQKEPPPAPVPTHEELQTAEQAKLEAEYRALTPSTPLAAWLRFTRYGIPEQRQREAAAAIRGRTGFEQEMREAILGADFELSRETLRAFPYFAPPLLELAPLVRQKGDDIATALRARSALAPDDSARSDAGANISLDFSAWMEAVRSLQWQGDTTFVPQLQQIAQLSRTQPIDHVISVDVLRVASYYLHTWAGIPPQPEDPPPR